MSPEQAAGNPQLDARSDIYNVGAVAYYLLTGGPVFEGRPIEVIQSHLQASPESPSARLGRLLPRKLEGLVLECLEKDPNLRPDSAQALMDRLGACDDVEPWGADEARVWWRDRKTARSAVAVRGRQ